MVAFFHTNRSSILNFEVRVNILDQSQEQAKLIVNNKCGLY